LGKKVIDGKAISSKIRGDLSEKVCEFSLKNGRPPCLSVVLVGEDPASAIYVRMKGKACEETGIHSLQHTLPGDTPEDTLLELIDFMNRDPSIDGILVQLPLPPQIDEGAVIERINPLKDVDGFHPVNVGKLVTGQATLAPCTPHGIIKMLEFEKVPIKGTRSVVIGRSNIVGKPVALMLLAKHSTVTICHSRTPSLEKIAREGDILVAAVGKAGMVRGNMVKEGAVVIDVGVNRLPDGTLSGDVVYEEAYPRASKITPVPGGVGPMTITMLLVNTLEAAQKVHP